MTETLTGKQVLALLAQDEVPEIEQQNEAGDWEHFSQMWEATHLRYTSTVFRIKPKQARRLSVTLTNGEVVSWPEPVREALREGQEYWFVLGYGDIDARAWYFDSTDSEHRAFGNVHLTKEAAQEHADALRRINTQGVV